MTVYNKYIDPATRLEKYQRVGIVAVAWENRKAANVRSTGGLASADQARVFIPFACGVNFLQPKAWQALTTKTGKWTLQVGDLIVKGLVSDEIQTGFTVTALKAKYDDVLVITSVDTMDAGSPGMQHWNIGAA
jgi:hypothetical protein